MLVFLIENGTKFWASVRGVKFHFGSQEKITVLEEVTVSGPLGVSKSKREGLVYYLKLCVG